MESQGVVREWHDEDGWGVLDSEATPGGCWAHFSAVLVDGYRSLRAQGAAEGAAEHGSTGMRSTSWITYDDR
jgi:cold shock protein